MIKDTVSLVSELALVDCHRITQRFVREAIKKWDQAGQGCFQLWVITFLAMRWRELTGSN